MSRKAAYKEYLKSDHWKQFRIAKEATARKRCGICSSVLNVQLHHLFYRHPWTNAQLSDTRWLCAICHKTSHELINTGIIKFPRPENHLSCFVILKTAVKKARGFGNRNLFYPVILD